MMRCAACSRGQALKLGDIDVRVHDVVRYGLHRCELDGIDAWLAD